MTQTAEEFIELKKHLFEAKRDKPIRMKDIGREGYHFWHREAWTFRVQSNLPEKVFVVERIRHTHRTGAQAMEGGAGVGDIEYRIGYYIVGRIGKSASTWRWGQYAPMIPEADLLPLLAQATAEGTLLA
jgi:hypothetical protein